MIISKMDFYKRVNTRKELFGRKKRSTPFIIYTNFSMDRMRKLSEKENIFPTKDFFLCAVMFAVEQMQMVAQPDILSP